MLNAPIKKQVFRHNGQSWLCAKLDRNKERTGGIYRVVPTLKPQLHTGKPIKKHPHWTCVGVGVCTVSAQWEKPGSYIILSRTGVLHRGQVAFTTGSSITACQFSEQWTAHAPVSLFVCYGSCVCVCLSECMSVCARGCKQVNNNNHKSIPVPIPRGQVFKTVNKGLGKKDYSSSANSSVHHPPSGKDHKSKKKKKKGGKKTNRERYTEHLKMSFSIHFLWHFVTYFSTKTLKR